jgi:hypothetical protein
MLLRISSGTPVAQPVACASPEDVQPPPIVVRRGKTLRLLSDCGSYALALDE